MVSKDEETNCINNIANTNRFKSFKYKAKLLQSWTKYFEKKLPSPTFNVACVC